MYRVVAATDTCTVKRRTGNGYELRCISCEAVPLAETDTKAEFTVISDGLGVREESNG